MSVALPIGEGYMPSPQATNILPSLPAMDHGFDEDDDDEEYKNNISSLPPTQEHVFDEDEDEAAKPKNPITFSAFEKDVSSSSSEEEEEEDDNDEFADHPDPMYLNQLSDHKISKHHLTRLPAWSFLICIDRLDRKTWKLPYRDGLGRLNRPFLARAREVLTSRKLVEEMGIALDQETRAHALQCFARAWPGQPCTLVQAMNQPIITPSTQLVVSTEDLLARGDALLQESRPAKRKAALQAAANIASAPAVLSDAAPNLLMKLDMRLQKKRPAAAAKQQLVPERAALVAATRTKHVDLRLLAKQKLAQKREHKSKIGRAVEEEYRVPTPPLQQLEEEEEEEDKPKEYEDDDDENDSDFVPGEGGDDEDEDKKEQAVSELVDEEEAQFGDTATNAEDGEEEESNAKYRALLEVDAKLAANNGADNNRFVENQAEEEEEDAILKERVIGQADSDGDDNDEGDLRVTEEDLRGIVDVATDDTEQGRNQVMSLFQQQQEDADVTLENKLSRDLKNHTLIASRKRMHASKLDKAMMEDDSEEETDEEQEMAKMLRFERETQSALDALQASSAAQSVDAMDEEEEEIRRELEQAQGFLKRSLTLKRQLSNASGSRSGAITPSLDSFSSQMLEQDEDTKAVWEGLNSSSAALSNAAMEAASSNSNSMSLFRQELKHKIPAAASKRARGLFASSAAATSSRGIASLSRAFVYTKNVSASQPLPSSQSNEEDGDAARTGFESISASQDSTMTANNKKRRIALKAVPIGSLPIAKLLEPNRMQRK